MLCYTLTTVAITDVTQRACTQEFCNGGNLRRAVDRGYFAGAFPRRWASITGVLAGIAGGMQYVHSKRILHGDLNPSNILLKVHPCLLNTHHFWGCFGPVHGPTYPHSIH